MARTTKAGKADHHRVVDKRNTPMTALFEDWELVNWQAINKAVASGKAVLIEQASANEQKHWIGCALRELGRQNVYATFCHVRLDDRPSYGLWIMPRAALSGVLLEGCDNTHGS